MLRVSGTTAAAAWDALPTSPHVHHREKTSAALFFKYNTQLGPPYQVLVDTNFINFAIKNKVITDLRVRTPHLSPYCSMQPKHSSSLGMNAPHTNEDTACMATAPSTAR